MFLLCVLCLVDNPVCSQNKLHKYTKFVVLIGDESSPHTELEQTGEQE